MTAPVLLGVLYDFPQGDEGAGFETAVRLGVEPGLSGPSSGGLAGVDGRLDRPVELVSRHAAGLPGGTIHAVEQAFAELVATGVLAVIGPSISDNGLVVRDLADAAGLPCINYTGGERTRSELMFHYQVGSLEEEPILLAHHLAARGLTTVALVHDRSPVGTRYAECLADALPPLGVELVGRAGVAPLADDLTPVLRRLQHAAPAALCYLGLGVAARAVAVGLKDLGWTVPVVANSALMFGYARKDWRADWEGWTYVDTVADGNAERQALRERSPASAAGPVGVAAYDIGRLLAAGLARAPHLTRAGVKEGLEQVKRLPAASGLDGTTMGFGCWDRGALEGDYLVLRQWRDGRTVELTAAATPAAAPVSAPAR
jgi:ABC-type branched-subunit amino acid transport system substrate-binding protein